MVGIARRTLRMTVVNVQTYITLFFGTRFLFATIFHEPLLDRGERKKEKSI